MNFVNYLKNPQLVANFQHFFGIQSIVTIDQCNGEQIHMQEDHSIEEYNIQNNLIKRSIRINGSTKKPIIESIDRIDNDFSDTKKSNKKNYEIKNWNFYYLFCFGASLGYEWFYALFFPFFLHNIDPYVGRRLIVIWSIIMYIGQALKDIIRWKRPESPPVVVLEPEYSMEYDMPSTHAMVGFSLPFSIFIFTQSRYIYPFWLGLILACFWCLLVCSSRLYLGMHTVLDIIVGLVLSATILSICVPLIDLIDEVHSKSVFAPLITFILVCLMSTYYPKSDRWSPARGDTCVMIGFGSGVLIGAWLNYQLDTITDWDYSFPHHINWPSVWIILLMLLRSSISILSIELTRQLEPRVEVPLKLITYTVIGITIAAFLPMLFKRLGIGQ